jgi:preprotein translocase subunit SecG
MTTGFMILTVLFIIVSAVMILIVLVQRPQGGGLAGAFGGAGGGSTDTVFGGRVGDALTVMTVVAFAAYLLLAIGLNVMDNNRSTAGPNTVLTSGDGAATQPADTSAPTPPPTRGSPNTQAPTGAAPTGNQSSGTGSGSSTDQSKTPAATAPETADAPPGR